MRYTLGLALTLALVLAGNVVAEVREIATMSAILPAIDDRTLVIFDLDNTLIEPAQSLGSDQWVSMLTKRFVATGTPEPEATDRAVGMFTRIQYRTRIVPVEALNPGLVRELQDRGITVLGLTARPLDLVDRTREELASVGIDLARRPLIAAERRTLAGGTALYDRGIAFVGPHNNKGRMLATLLADAGLQPARVVFVDDKAHHTAAVDAVMSAQSVPVVAFRYAAADPTVAALDTKLVDFAWAHFLATGTILSDAEARQAMGRSPSYGVTGAGR